MRLIIVSNVRSILLSARVVRNSYKKTTVNINNLTRFNFLTTSDKPTNHNLLGRELGVNLNLTIWAKDATLISFFLYRRMERRILIIWIVLIHYLLFQIQSE